MRSDVAFEEVDDGGVGLEFVFELDDAVAFVVEDEEVDGDVTPAQGGDELFGFGDGYAGVVGAVDDHERRADAVLSLIHI